MPDVTIHAFEGHKWPLLCTRGAWHGSTSRQPRARGRRRGRLFPLHLDAAASPGPPPPAPHHNPALTGLQRPWQPSLGPCRPWQAPHHLQGHTQSRTRIQADGRPPPGSAHLHAAVHAVHAHTKCSRSLRVDREVPPSYPEAPRQELPPAAAPPPLTHIAWGLPRPRNPHPYTPIMRARAAASPAASPSASAAAGRYMRLKRTS